MIGRRVLGALIPLAALFAGGWLAGCSDSDEAALVTVRMSENPIQVASDQGSKAVVLDPGGPNIPWTIKSNDSYLTAAPSDGAGVTELQVRVDRTQLNAGVTTSALEVTVPTARVKVPVMIAVAAR